MIKHNTGQLINNRYRIVTLLNQGGFGAVYRAWDINLNAPCALKQNIDTTPEAAEQFAREASFLANLRHPNLPRVIDHFSLPNQGQYLVMDFIAGQDLQEMIDAAGMPLPEEMVLHWVQQVMDALIYLHNQNPPIVHRDVKLANVRITPEGTAVLVDFGIAKRYDPQRRTSIGARATTPGYAPVEQYGQAPTDVRSDVYSLGATLYAALTNQVPPESISRAGGHALIPPIQLNPRISPHVESVILKAMALMPEERYQTMKEFKSALFGDKGAGAVAAGFAAAQITRPETPPTQVAQVPEAVMMMGQVSGQRAAVPPPVGQPMPAAAAVSQAGLAQPAEKRRSPWMFCGIAVAAVILLALCGLGGWLGYSYFSSTSDTSDQATRTQLALDQEALDQTQTALDNAQGVQATQNAGQTATLQAATELPPVVVASPTAEAATTTEAPATVTIAVTTAAPASLEPIDITEWGMSYFAMLSGGCKEKPSLCFKLNDNYRDTQSGAEAFLVSKQEVYIDPAWPSPHLVFWTSRILPHNAVLDIGFDGNWQTIRKFSKDRVEWQQDYVDLGLFKGKDILVRFYSYINGFPQSTWFLERIQVVPDFKP